MHEPIMSALCVTVLPLSFSRCEGEHLQNISKPDSPFINGTTLSSPSRDIALRVDALPRLKLPIFPCKHHTDRQRKQRRDQRDSRSPSAAGQVARPLGGRVHVRPVDVGGVADHVGKRNTNAALDEGPGEAVGDPGQDDLVSGDSAHGHEEHGEEADSRVERRDHDDVARHRHQHERDDVPAALAVAARGPGDDQRHQEGADPDGRRDEQGLDVAEAERLDDSGEHVLEALRQQRRVLQQREQVQSRVAEG